MTSNELKEILTNLTIWKKNGQRASHKPLLILYALAQFQRGIRSIRFISPKIIFSNGMFGKCLEDREGIWQNDNGRRGAL